jgi:hypothetical protein
LPTSFRSAAPFSLLAARDVALRAEIVRLTAHECDTPGKDGLFRIWHRLPVRIWHRLPVRIWHRLPVRIWHRLPVRIWHRLPG